MKIDYAATRLEMRIKNKLCERCEVEEAIIYFQTWHLCKGCHKDFLELMKHD